MGGVIQVDMQDSDQGNTLAYFQSIAGYECVIMEFPKVTVARSDQEW